MLSKRHGAWNRIDRHEGGASAPTVRTIPGWDLLRTRNFRLLWLGQVASQIGDALNKVALLWFVYELTGSALKMAVIGLLQTIPPLLFGPLIGVYLDRLRKKPVMIWVDLVRAALIAMIPTGYACGLLTLERLYALVFVTSIVSTVFGPALASAVPQIVDRPRLTAANALIQSTNHIGLLLGPAVSGLGIALIGAHNVLYVDAATFLLSALCLMPIGFVEWSKNLGSSENRAPVLHDILEGLRFILLQRRTISLLMITATLYSLGASAFVFVLPVFGKELLGVGPALLGLLWSALGVGMLAGTAWLAVTEQGNLRERFRTIARATAVGGLAVCGLSQLETVLAAGIFVAVIGVSTALFTPIVWTSLQELTPADLSGRVFTTFSVGAMSSAMAGITGFGWMMDQAGPEASLIGIGLVLLATATVAIRYSRRCGGQQTFSEVSVAEGA